MRYCRGVTARDVGRRLSPYAFPLVASAFLGFLAIRGILDRAGRPALPLDDSFIHLQYARRLAEGGFFSYVKGEGYTTGATSLLWPLVLAPFYALGLRGLSFVWAAWLLGTLSHAALAVETMRITERLAGKTAAKGALVLSLCFGAFAWFAWSGMETIPFAWMLMRTTRVAASYCEPLAAAPDTPPDTRSVSFVEVALFGFLTPLMRPEGALAAGIALISMGGNVRVDLMHFLFGNILGIDSLDMWLAAAVSSATANSPSVPSVVRDTVSSPIASALSNSCTASWAAASPPRSASSAGTW